MLKVTPVRIKLAESSQLLNAFLYYKAGFLKLEIIGERPDFYDTAGPQIEFTPNDLAPSKNTIFAPPKLIPQNPIGYGANRLEFILFRSFTGYFKKNEVLAHIGGSEYKPRLWPWAIAGAAAVTLPWLIYVFQPLSTFWAIFFSVGSFGFVAIIGYQILNILLGKYKVDRSPAIILFTALHGFGGIFLFFESTPLFALYVLCLVAWLAALWIGAGLIEAMLGFVAYMFLGAVVMFRLTLTGFEISYHFYLAATYGIEILKTESIRENGRVEKGKYIHTQGFEFPIPEKWTSVPPEKVIGRGEFRPGTAVAGFRPLNANGDKIALYLLPEKLPDISGLREQYIRLMNFQVRSGQITEPNYVKFSYESFPVSGGIVFPIAFDYSLPLDDTDRRLTVYYVALKEGSLVFVCDEGIQWTVQRT